MPATNYVGAWQYGPSTVDPQPAPRAFHAAGGVTSERNTELVVFGGQTADGVSAELWKLPQGVIMWRNLTTDNGPAARCGHSYTLWTADSLILFGGSTHCDASQIEPATFSDFWVCTLIMRCR